jgi:hypothetical protein
MWPRKILKNVLDGLIDNRDTLDLLDSAGSSRAN